MSIKNNTTSLQNLLEIVNNLPDVNEGGGSVELPELTNEGSAADLLFSKQFIDGDGNIITGAMTDNGAVTKTLNTNTTSYTIPKGYHSGSGKISITTESKSITPTKSVQTISPTSGKVLSSVSVAAIPSQYITTSDATASTDEIMSGETAYVNGSKITGTFSIDSELNAQDSLITQIQSALQGKATGSGGANIETCIGTIDTIGALMEEPEIYFLDKNLTLQHMSISFMNDGDKIEVVKNSIIYIKYVYPSGDENIVVLEGTLNSIKACYVLNDFTITFST